MKRRRIIVVLLCVFFSDFGFGTAVNESSLESENNSSFEAGYAIYDKLLNQFLKNESVNYSELKKNPELLNRYLSEMAEVDKSSFKKLTEDQQIAYLINLYNAATLKLIIDHYPVESIKDIGWFLKGPFDQQIVKLFDDTVTLDTLEHKILRKDYDEPRIHAALVCAAKGCPPLKDEAYRGNKLDQQLDEQVKVFLESDRGLQIGREENVVYLSSIFKWFGEDFVNKYTPHSGFDGFNERERAVLNFCSRYVSEDNQRYLQTGDYSIEYLDYDWSLNEIKDNK